jgi:STE24 endopeptidase
MHPLLQTVIAILVGASYFVLQEGAPGEPLSLLRLGSGATAAVTLFSSLLPLPIGAWLMARVRREPEDAEAEARRAARRAARRFRSLPVVLFTLQVWVLGWPEIVNVLGIKGWVLVDKLLLILPFALALLASWVLTYRLESRQDAQRTSLGRYLAFHCRMAALPCLPIFAFFAVIDTVELIEPVRVQFEYQPYLAWLLVIAFVVAIFVFFPLALRTAWGAESLPSGPLRDKLESLAARTGFRFRDILRWNTGGRIVNAAILGLVGRYRYVVLSDGLLSTLREDEVVPVFAHEVGHAKHHHVLLYLLFSLSYVCVLYVINGAFLGRHSLALEAHPVLVLLGVIGLFAVYWGLVFGFLSRRFELEADVFAAEALGDTTLLVDTLERLSRLSGRARTLWSWRHFSIANRVDFLVRYRTDPEIRRRFRLKIKLLVGATIVVLCAGVAIAAREIRREREYALGRLARLEGDLALAAARFEAAIELDPGDPRFWIALGDVRFLEGRATAARECARRAHGLEPLAEPVRRELEALDRKLSADSPERPQPSPER